MLVDCPSMAQYRSMCSIGPYIEEQKRMNPRVSSIKLYAKFLSDKNHKLIQQRAHDLYVMKVGWHKLMKIEI